MKTTEMIAFLSCTVLCCFEDSAPKGKSIDHGKVLQFVERIVNLDDGNQSINVRNGEVMIRTTAIKEIVALGPSAIPILTEAMKTKELSFDAFTRCYSACLQILREVDRDADVFWGGGCLVKKNTQGVSRVFPSGQLNETAFRERVVSDIQGKYKKIKQGEEGTKKHRHTGHCKRCQVLTPFPIHASLLSFSVESAASKARNSS